jgi:hypothetical protein
VVLHSEEEAAHVEHEAPEEQASHVEHEARSHLVSRPNQMLIVRVPRNQVYTYTVQKINIE